MIDKVNKFDIVKIVKRPGTDQDEEDIYYMLITEPYTEEEIDHKAFMFVERGAEERFSIVWNIVTDPDEIFDALFHNLESITEHIHRSLAERADILNILVNNGLIEPDYLLTTVYFDNIATMQ